MERLWSLLLGISQTSIYRQTYMQSKQNPPCGSYTTNCIPFTRAVIECVLSLLLGLQHLSLWDDQCSTRGKDLPKDFAISDFYFEICSVRFNEIFSGMKNCSSCRWRSTYSHIIPVVADVWFYKVGHGTYCFIA